MMKVGLLVSLGAVAASCLASAASNLPRLRAERWVNSPPLSAEALRGKVVIVDFGSTRASIGFGRPRT